MVFPFHCPLDCRNSFPLFYLFFVLLCSSQSLPPPRPAPPDSAKSHGRRSSASTKVATTVAAAVAANIYLAIKRQHRTGDPLVSLILIPNKQKQTASPTISNSTTNPASRKRHECLTTSYRKPRHGSEK